MLVLQGSGVFSHKFNDLAHSYSCTLCFYVFIQKDQTATFMHEATEFFVNENVPRFVRGEDLLNHVDKVAGY